jgi:hypothetical protein
LNRRPPPTRPITACNNLKPNKEGLFLSVEQFQLETGNFLLKIKMFYVGVKIEEGGA